ncbi:MAG: hypothetical protein ABEJ94_07135 [Halorientalis sp.]
MIDQTVAAASRHERWLWALVAASLLGDIALTGFGLRRGLIEGNPVVRAAVTHAGIGMLVVLKAGAVGFGLTVRASLSGHERGVVPLGLGLPWVGATLVNATLLVA